MNDDDWVDPNDPFADDDTPETFRPKQLRTATPESNRSSPLVVAGIVLGCLFSVVAIGAVGYMLVTRDSPDGAPIMAPRSRAQLRHEASQVFNRLPLIPGGPTVSVFDDEADRAGVRQFADQLEEFTAAEETILGHLLDVDRMLARIEQSGVLSSWNRFERNGLKSELQSWEVSESQWARIVLVDVLKPVDVPDNRIVYAHGYDLADDPVELRLWISRGEDGWKLYDWERLDLGLTETRDWELFLRYQDTPDVTAFDRWVTSSQASDTALRDGDNDAARQHLHAAQAVAVPPERASYCKVLNGYRWQGIGDYDEALKCFESVADKDEVPGAYIGLMYGQQSNAPKAALAAAENYERLLGPSIPICETKAEILTALNREDEATAEWERLASLEPEHIPALIEVLVSLPRNEKSKFASRLQAVSDPVELASQLARRAAYRDFDALKWLDAYITQTTPETAEAYAINGLVALHSGEFTGSADSYAQAMAAATVEETRNQYMYSFLDSSVNAGRLVAGYRASPDRLEAFVYLTDAWDEYDLEIGRPEFEELLEAHAEFHPDDPWLTFYLAELAIEDEDYARAEALLGPTLQQLAEVAADADADDDYLETRGYQQQALSNQLAVVMCWTGRTREAIERDPEHLSLLGNNCLANYRLGELRELLKSCADSHAEEAAFHRLSGSLAAVEQRWSAAFDHYVRAGELIADGDFWRGDAAAAQAAVRSGRWMELMNRPEANTRTFSVLADSLIESQQWSVFSELINAVRENDAIDDFERLSRLAKVHWLRGEYSACAQVSGEAIEAADDYGGWQVQQLADQEVTALLRAGLTKQAADRAREFRDETGNPELQAVVAAATGDQDSALQFAQENGTDARNLYGSIDTAAIFLSEPFRPLHEKHPVPVSYFGGTQTTASFLLTEMVTLDAAAITAAIHDLDASMFDQGLPVIGDVEVLDQTDGPPVFLMRLSSGTVWCRVTTPDLKQDWRLRSMPPELADRVNQSVACLTLGVSGLTEELREPGLHLARWLGAGLARDKSQLVRLYDLSAWWISNLYETDDPEFPTWLKSGNRSLLDSSAPQIVERDERMTPLREYEHRLRAAVREQETAESAPLQICVLIGDDVCGEPLWFAVKNIERSYSIYTFQGTLSGDSRLVPELQAGLQVTIHFDAVEGWRIGDNPPTYRP